MVSETVEEYLEALYRIKEKKEKATTVGIAKAMGVSPASASQMMNRLAKEGYIKHEPYKGAVLTRKGSRIGKRILRKHRVIEGFLERLGIRKGRAHREACKLEHVTPDELEEEMRSRLSPRNPRHHRFIRRRKGMVSVSDLRKGDSAKIVSIEAGHMAKRRLEEMGLTSGTEIMVERVVPVGGPVEISVRGSCLVLGRGIARRILVEVPNE